MKKLHIAVIIIGIIFILLPAFHTNIWYDEAYTVAMETHSFYEIWTIGSNDVHPVLYYFMLKFVNLLFGTNILAYRLFSVLPVIILGILGFTHIRKDFGEKTGLVFTFLVFFLPGLTRYTTEIRMYSWAMLFASVTAIYAYRLYKDKLVIKNLCLFGIFSLACAYTHYFGLMTSGIINLMLFIYLIKNIKEKKKDFLMFIICAIIQVALYLPWFMIFISQTTSVVENGFWITLKFPDTLLEVLTVEFVGRSYIMRYIVIIPIILLYFVIGITIHKLRKEKEDIKPGILALMVYVLVAIAALIVSIIARPILMDRYLLVDAGLLIFFISYFIGRHEKKTVNIIICIITLIFSAITTFDAIKANYSPSNDAMLDYVSENIQENDSFLIYHDEISGFAISVRHPRSMQYFHDYMNWGAGGAYDSFKPNIMRSSELSEIMNAASGRIWIINISEEDLQSEILDKYNAKLIERKEFQTTYNGYFFSFSIINKV